MHPTTRRTGRVRTLIVLAAMALPVFAGSAALADETPPAHAQGPAEHAPGLLEDVEAREQAPNAPWNQVGDDEDVVNGGGFTTMGFSWF